MQSVELKVSKRESVGKKANKALRKEKQVPAVVYGGEKNFNMSFDENEFMKYYSRYKHSNILYDLSFDNGEKVSTLLKSIDIHPTRHYVIHADFYELVAGKKLKAKINLKINGTPAGVREGGVLEHFVWDVEIECFPKDLPDSIEIDVSELNIGDSIFVRDLPVGDEIRVLDNPDEIVLTVGLPAKEEEVVTEESETAVEGEEGTAEEAKDKEEKKEE